MVHERLLPPSYPPNIDKAATAAACKVVGGTTCGVHCVWSGMRKDDKKSRADWNAACTNAESTEGPKLFTLLKVMADEEAAMEQCK